MKATCDACGDIDQEVVDVVLSHGRTKEFLICSDCARWAVQALKPVRGRDVTKSKSRLDEEHGKSQRR